MTARRAAPIRVFLIDDHAVVLAGLAGILGREPDIEVVGEAENAEAALELLPAAAADVAILDYRLAGMRGDVFCMQIAKLRLPLDIVILSAHMDEEAVQGCFLAGAKGYVVKDIDAAELKRAIRAVARGGTYVDPKVAGRLVGRAARLDVRSADSLRPVEIEILGHVGEGRTNQEIAALLGLSRHTIGSRLADIFRKLGVHQRAEAVAVSIRRGLIPSQMHRSRSAEQKASEGSVF